MVPDSAWPGSDQRPSRTASSAGLVGWLGRPSASDPWGAVCYCLSLRRRRCACVRCPWPLGAHSSLCAPSVFFCVVSVATWHLFTGARTRCVLCAVPIGHPALVHRSVLPSRSLCGFDGHLALIHRCARPVCSVYRICGHLALVQRRACAVCSVCGVRGPLTLVHRCVCPACWRSCVHGTGACVRLFLGAVSVATWQLFTSVRAGRVMCAASSPTWRFITGVPAGRLLSAVSVASRHLFTGACAAFSVRGICGILVLVHRCVCQACWRCVVHGH